MSEITCSSGGASTAAFIEALSQAIGEEKFQIWFGQLGCTLLDSDVLELELPNANYVRWVQEKFSTELKQAASLAIGTEASLALRSSESSSELARLTQSRVSSGYTQIPNRWLDELRPRIGLVPWCVFETLLRFVWRGETKIKTLQKHLKRGELVAYVSKPKLAQKLGLSTRSVRSNLHKLELLGLVQVSHQPHGGPNIYVLGHTDGAGERWLADSTLFSSEV